MRDILFRAKWLYNGEWVEGCFIEWSDGSCSIEAGRPDKPTYYIDPETVGQYTGLTDKNGKRIFEGDIVSGLSWISRPVSGVVDFKYGAFGVKWLRGKVDEFSEFTSCCNVEWVVIGNVHDNHELLEGGANDG